LHDDVVKVIIIIENKLLFSYTLAIAGDTVAHLTFLQPLLHASRGGFLRRNDEFLFMDVFYGPILLVCGI
jgi:hypothetical protein